MKRKDEIQKVKKSTNMSICNCKMIFDILCKIGLCLLLIIHLSGCTENHQIYYKDAPQNFMLNILDRESDLYNVIKKEWFSSFNPDEGTTYDLYITDDYFSAERDSQEIKFLNTGLFITDMDNDRFVVSKDYLCYRNGNKWIVKDIEEFTEQDIKCMKAKINDSLYLNYVKQISTFRNKHKSCSFKSIHGKNSQEKQAIHLCQKLHELFWITSVH